VSRVLTGWLPVAQAAETLGFVVSAQFEDRDGGGIARLSVAPIGDPESYSAAQYRAAAMRALRAYGYTGPIPEGDAGEAIGEWVCEVPS
jgi:hypothetical protein